MRVLVTWPATSPKTKAYEVSCRKRKKVEMLFAHLKRILKLGRLRLRGPNGAKDEFLLAAAAQNLRKPAKLRPRTRLWLNRHDPKHPDKPKTTDLISPTRLSEK